MGTTEEKVRQQVEFYMSSSNLMKDKFLRPIVQAEPEGYVDIALLAGFPRVQQITRDRDLLVRALRRSTELEVDAAGNRVRRREPFVEYDTEANTVYAENLPEGFDHDVVRKMMEKYGKVNYVSLPRHQDKSFKGFAFVEFARREDALAAVSGLNEYDEMSNPQGLRVMHKQEWLAMKQAQNPGGPRRRQPMRNHHVVGGQQDDSAPAGAKGTVNRGDQEGEEKRGQKRKQSADDENDENANEAEKATQVKKKKKSKKNKQDELEEEKASNENGEEEEKKKKEKKKKKKKEKKERAEGDKEEKKKKRKKNEDEGGEDGEAKKKKEKKKKKKKADEEDDNKKKKKDKKDKKKKDKNEKETKTKKKKKKATDS